jgi:hypothetical protein
MSTKKSESELLEWIEGRFPQLTNRIPSHPVYMEFGSSRMFSSHDLRSLGNWLSSSGFPRFIRDPDVPDGFFACGISSPAVSESLHVLWKEGDRYFWLYDQYALYVVENSGVSISETRKNMDMALAKWNEGKQQVILLMGRIHEWDPDFW